MGGGGRGEFLCRVTKISQYFEDTFFRIILNFWLSFTSYYRGYEITTKQTMATQISDLSETFYVRGFENLTKVVDLLAQKLLNVMTLD